MANYIPFLIIQDHSLPVQVFVNKPGEGKERPASPSLSQTSFSSSCSIPQLCSTPKAGSIANDESVNNDCFNDASQDNCDVEVVENSTENEKETPQQENGMGKFSIQYQV